MPSDLPRQTRCILDRLDSALRRCDINLPGYGFHRLKGERKGAYAVSVSGNWRMTFRFEGDTPLTLIWRITTDEKLEKPKAQAHAPRRGAEGGRVVGAGHDANRARTAARGIAPDRIRACCSRSAV